MNEVGPGGEEAIEVWDERSGVDLGGLVKSGEGADHDVAQMVGGGDGACESLQLGEVVGGGDVAQLEVGAVGDLEVGEVVVVAEVGELVELGGGELAAGDA